MTTPRWDHHRLHAHLPCHILAMFCNQQVKSVYIRNLWDPLFQACHLVLQADAGLGRRIEDQLRTRIQLQTGVGQHEAQGLHALLFALQHPNEKFIELLKASGLVLQRCGSQERIWQHNCTATAALMLVCCTD